MASVKTKKVQDAEGRQVLGWFCQHCPGTVASSTPALKRVSCSEDLVPSLELEDALLLRQLPFLPHLIARCESQSVSDQ